MIFYLLHNIINNLNFTSEWNESKKNCFTLIIGGTLYVLLYIFLEYIHKKSGSMFIELLHKFFLYFIIIDIITMAIMYKLYWGRSILNEVIPNEDTNWVLNEETHKFQRKKDLEVDEIIKFNQRKQELEDLHENVDDLRDNMQQMSEKTDQMEEALLYHPDGEMVQELKEEFDNLKEQNNVEIITDDDNKDSS